MINEKTLGIIEIKKHQQNRYPLLFIDKVYEIIPGKSVKSRKCFSYNEWFFPAHFEDEPNVPGFVLVESMVQTFIMTFLTIEKFKGQKTNFSKIENVKFKQKVVPGDVLDLYSELTSFKRGIAKGWCKALLGSVEVCSGEFVVVLPSELIQMPAS